MSPWLLIKPSSLTAANSSFCVFPGRGWWNPLLLCPPHPPWLQGLPLIAEASEASEKVSTHILLMARFGAFLSSNSSLSQMKVQHHLLVEHDILESTLQFCWPKSCRWKSGVAAPPFRNSPAVGTHLSLPSLTYQIVSSLQSFGTGSVSWKVFSAGGMRGGQRQMVWGWFA